MVQTIFLIKEEWPSGWRRRSWKPLNESSVGSNPTSSATFYITLAGEMTESAEGARLLSECRGYTLPRVRIPVSPPFFHITTWYYSHLMRAKSLFLRNEYIPLVHFGGKGFLLWQSVSRHWNYYFQIHDVQVNLLHDRRSIFLKKGLIWSGYVVVETSFPYVWNHHGQKYYFSSL